MTRRTVLALGGLVLGSPLPAESLRLQPNAASEFALEVKKTGLLAGKKHHLVFRQYDGVVSPEPMPRVTFTVQAVSLVCEDGWVKPKDREKIRRYALDDLLEAVKYPLLRFRSTAVRPNGDGYAIAGDLTVKEQTRPVMVLVTRRAERGATLWTGGATIRLTDFHLKPPTAALGAIGTEDAMQVLFHFAAVSEPRA